MWGYPAGSVVPIGLYTLSDDPTSLSLDLIEQIGIVTMPRYRVAEFVVPSRVLDRRPAGFHCLLPPTPADAPAHCDQIWPDYPGIVRTADRGEKVLRWQDILMSADILNSTPENRTGHYDVLQTRLVAAWQEGNGVVADGVLGPDLYAAITGAVAPEG